MYNRVPAAAGHRGGGGGVGGAGGGGGGMHVGGMHSTGAGLIGHAVTSIAVATTVAAALSRASLPSPAVLLLLLLPHEAKRPELVAFGRNGKPRAVMARAVVLLSSQFRVLWPPITVQNPICLA